MQTVTTIEALRCCTRTWRQNGQTIAFVPTMGNLHAGHISLVQAARQQADRVVVSIFVNPTQFGPNEDFASYPRTEQQDQAQLLGSGTDLLFLPSADEMYPKLTQTRVSVSELSTLLCGASRPGHFDGVAIVVCKLLNMVQPDVLLLGEKDFQQLTVIKTMVSDLNLPLTVQGIATVRETDGLAMSSRNGYLSPSERQVAPLLYQILCDAREAIINGRIDFQAIIDEQTQKLKNVGFLMDYLQICRKIDLHPATATDQELVILVAAKLGKTRLIDNVYFTRPVPS
jgi:pantoate--beta-alanine ligase